MLTTWKNEEYKEYSVIETGVQKKVKPKLLDEFLKESEYPQNYLATFYILNKNDVMKLQKKDEPLEKIYLAHGRDDHVKYTAQYFVIDIDTDNPKGMEEDDPEYKSRLELLEISIIKFEWVKGVFLNMGIDMNSIYTFFSGMKGFHINIPSEHFGGWKPKVMFQNTFYNIYNNFKIPEGYADPSIYSRRRGIRVVNSQHPTSNLYKIQLKHTDVMMGADHILKLAKTPRETWEINTSKIYPNDNLITFTQAPTSKDEEKPVKAQNKPSNYLSKQIKKADFLKKNKKVGERNVSLREYLRTHVEMGVSDPSKIYQKTMEFLCEQRIPESYGKVIATVNSVLNFKGFSYNDNPLRLWITNDNYLHNQLTTWRQKHTYIFICTNVYLTDGYWDGVKIKRGQFPSGKFKTPERLNQGFRNSNDNIITPSAYEGIIQKFVKDKAMTRHPVKDGKKDKFSILTPQFFDIENYITIKDKK